MRKRSFEYDAFGPWIYRIDEKHTLPPLFKGYEEDLASALMQFKIPRDIERAAANPDMHLYDLVLGIFETEILLLERIEDEVFRSAIPLGELQSIGLDKCLLSGKLTLFTREKTVEIKFNTVSSDIVAEAVELLRRLRPIPRYEMTIPQKEYNFGTMEHAFVNVVNSVIEKNPEAFLIAYQPNFRYTRQKKRQYRFLPEFLIRETIVSSFVILSNHSELLWVVRSYSLKEPSVDYYMYSSYYIPLRDVKGVRIRDQKSDIRCCRLEIETSIETITLRFDRNQTDIKALGKTLSGILRQ